MIGLSLVMKRINGRSRIMGRTMGGIRRRRLQIVEILPLDARRRAILLRRDDREHLVILGTQGETVIETNIESPQDNPHDSRISAASDPA